MSKNIPHALSRRRLLGITVGFGGACLFNLSGCGKSPSVALCADPNQLSQEQLSLRTSLRYTERAAGKERCAACAFFKATENAACGDCDLLKSSVNPQGHCVSWSKLESGER